MGEKREEKKGFTLFLLWRRDSNFVREMSKCLAITSEIFSLSDMLSARLSVTERRELHFSESIQVS